MTLPEILPLWDHQRQAAKMAEGLRDFGFLFEMGCGKTGATIYTLRKRYAAAGGLMRTLVFAPIVALPNWKAEFAKHSKIPQDRIHLLKGTGKKRLAILEAIKGPAVVVANYEALSMPAVFDALIRWSPEIIVADESQRLKNGKSLRAKAAFKLAESARHRYILSGTPLLNTPMDIYGQFRFLDLGATFGRNFIQFRAHYFEDKNSGMPAHKYYPNWQPRPGAYEEFNRGIYSKCMRVLKQDCLDLPPLVRRRVAVEMGAKQRANYLAMEKEFIAYLEGRACVASIALTKGLRLQQIVSGFFKETEEDSGEVIHYEDNPRIDALEEILEEIGPEHKVIIWACFRENYVAIEKLLQGLKVSYRMLVGGMTDKARQGSIDDFQGLPGVRYLIANQSAGGIAVNLTAASYSVYFSRNFSLEADLQSESRNHRGGSEVHEKITRIDLVVPGTMDEKVMDALLKKENMAASILAYRRPR